jgi:hypothetical protein
MFEDLNQLNLLGKSIPEPERDYDDEKVNSEYGQPVAEDALKIYYFDSITNNIGKEDFKEEYIISMQHIKEYPLEDLRSFIETILEQIKTIYDFEVPVVINFNNQSEVDDLLEFLAFVEFDHEDFIVTTWKYLNPDLKLFKIEKFCEQNSDKIALEIDNQIDSHDFSKIISIFLGTYIKDKLIDWFCDRSKKLRTAILIKLLEE